MTSHLTDNQAMLYGGDETMTTKNQEIPQVLHEQLSKQGKEGVKVLTPELRSKGGKNSWKARLKRAQEAQKAKEEKQ